DVLNPLLDGADLSCECRSEPGLNPTRLRVPDNSVWVDLDSAQVRHPHYAHRTGAGGDREADPLNPVVSDHARDADATHPGGVPFRDQLQKSVERGGPIGRELQTGAHLKGR